eukprot:884253-Amphidinium_carterae.1
MWQSGGTGKIHSRLGAEEGLALGSMSALPLVLLCECNTGLLHGSPRSCVRGVLGATCEVPQASATIGKRLGARPRQRAGR